MLILWFDLYIYFNHTMYDTTWFNHTMYDTFACNLDFIQTVHIWTTFVHFWTTQFVEQYLNIFCSILDSLIVEL